MHADRIRATIDSYLARLRDALGDVPSSERDEILREIRSHILERAEAEGPVTEQVVNQVLRAVGDPQELAKQYRADAILRLAASSRSPWLLLAATLRSATRGITGMIAFLVASVGYGCAAVAYLCAVLKPLVPDRIGLWLSPEHTVTLGYWNGQFSGTEVYGIAIRPPFSFVLGTLGATDGPVRELLGAWLVPAALVCGSLFLIGTTWITRGFIRRFRRQNLVPVDRVNGSAGES